MPYLPNIPQPTDDISVSQGNLLNNFVILGAIAGNTNAASASLNTNSGFNWVFLPTQGSIPPAAASFPSNTNALYSAVNTGTGGVEIYINKTIAGPGLVQIPMTAAKWSTLPNGLSGWVYLPSGMLFAWGQATVTAGNAEKSVVFSTAVPNFPGFTTFVANITLQRLLTYVGNPPLTQNFAVLNTNYTTNGFTFFASQLSTNVPFMWTALGL